jgi:nucleotide-binding universal stress UspA family protein
MSRIETILVPIDFERPSEHALAYAVGLAEQLGANVHVITTYELPIASFPDGALVASAEIVSRLIELSQAKLDDACAPYRNGKVPLTSHLEQGDPSHTIVEVAKARNASLIVMGTHGRKGLARALMGSTTEAVLRASDVPVLTVH